MKNNIRIAYIISFFDGLYFPISIWLFYYLQFLDFKQVAVITAVQVFTQNLFEIPTGAFADLVGRKTSVTISYILFSLAMFGIALSRSFWPIIIFEIMRSLANSFFSGSMEALLYDTLKQNNKENRYDKIIANIESLTWLGLFCSAIGGGFLYFLSPITPYFIQGLFSATGIIISLFLIEPKIDTKKYNLNIQILLKQNLLGFQELFKNLNITRWSLLFITVSAGYFIAASILGISQAKEYGFDSRGVGILFGIGYLLSAFASQAYPKIKKALGTEITLFITIGFLLSSFLFAKFVGLFWGTILIIGRIASSTTFRNIRSSTLNEFVTSKNRATAISTMVLLSQLPYAVLAYAIGDTIDQSSPNSFAFILGIILLSILVIQFLFFHFKPYYFKNSSNS